MHEKTAYIFVGQSGSGKGTQATLLDTALRTQNQLLTIFRIETGERFRAMIERESYTIARTREYIEAGKLPPSFLGVYSWSEMLVNDYNAEDCLIIDGTPRIIDEVPILIGALEFIDATIIVISIVVSDDWARDKATKRGRTDDRDAQELDGRLQWYHAQVEPVIDFFKKSDRVSFVEINGEQTIEEVHAEIVQATDRLAPVPKKVWQ